jgi:hypothetical protein
MNAVNHAAFTEAQQFVGASYARRDWTPRTPPFRLTEQQIDMLHQADMNGFFDMVLEDLHQRHCYRHRPVLGLANSLSVTSAIGDMAFSRDWGAHRDQHMAEALREWKRVNDQHQGEAA